MLNILNQAKLSKYAIVSIIIILIGVVGGTTHWLPGKLPYFSLLIAGALAIIIQFNWRVFAQTMGKINKSSIIWILPIIVLTFALSLGAVQLGNMLGFTSSANGAVGNGNQTQQLITLAFVCISLIGEELITAAITFPIFNLLSSKMSIKKAWIISSIIGALCFGLMHVNAYNFNLYQCLVVTGLTRLPFNWLWVKSNSLWGGIIAHIIYDLIVFLPMIFF